MKKKKRKKKKKKKNIFDLILYYTRYQYRKYISTKENFIDMNNILRGVVNERINQANK